MHVRAATAGPDYARELPSCELTMIPAQDYLHHRNIDDVLAHGSA